MNCYYRGLYSNARDADVPGAYWTVMFYCPVPTTRQGDCKSFEAQYEGGKDVTFKLTMHLQEVKWHSTIVTYHDGTRANKPPPHRPPDYHASIYEDGSSSIVQHSHLHELHESMAICTTWPFTTSDKKKVLINQAMVYEFMRYYANLGIKVIVYDREGGNAAGYANSAYARANPQRGRYRHALDRHVVYHNYTIHEVLQAPEIAAGVKAEYLKTRGDTETSKREEIHREMFNNDRGLTYSHCRFEARNKYGITRVIAADYDEFLFCKQAAATPRSQAAYMHAYLNQLEREGLDQAMFGKTTVAPRTYVALKKQAPSVKECLANEIQKNIMLMKSGANIDGLIKRKETSDYHNYSFVQSVTGVGPSAEIGNIFNCYSSLDFIDEIPNVKSVHLNNGCPFNCIHHACVPFESEYKGYDCICTTKRLTTCDFVHLSAVQNKFGFTKYDEEEKMKKYSELYFISNALD